jgi:hypothetical protein
MDPRSQATALVQEIMKDWGIKEEEAKSKEMPDMWNFIQGSARFHFQIFKFNKGQEQRDALEVGAIIMTLPEDKVKKDSLYQYVLEMNSTSCGVWFAVRGKLLMLLSAREIIGLDKVELQTMADDIRFYADYFDDIFVEKYGDLRKPGN